MYLVKPKSQGNEPAPPGVTRDGKAFTLVELLVVVIILALAAALVLPQAIGTSDMQAQAAARVLMADLEYAQSHAVVTQADVTVTFDGSGNSYGVSKQSQTLIHPITKKAYVVDFDTHGSFKTVSIGTVDFGGGSTVTFNALGTPSPDGSVDVGAGTHTYRVTVAPVTGRVSVAQVP